MHFEIVGEITQIETIARGASVRNRALLRQRYGPGRWRKLKGVAYVRLIDNTVRLAEIHWYQADGYRQKRFQIETPLSGLTMNTKENLLLPFGICLKNEGYLASLEIGETLSRPS